MWLATDWQREILTDMHVVTRSTSHVHATHMQSVFGWSTTEQLPYITVHCDNYSSLQVAVVALRVAGGEHVCSVGVWSRLTREGSDSVECTANAEDSSTQWQYCSRPCPDRLISASDSAVVSAERRRSLSRQETSSANASSTELCRPARSSS